jgi:hypothetical protein
MLSVCARLTLPLLIAAALVSAPAVGASGLATKTLTLRGAGATFSAHL